MKRQDALQDQKEARTFALTLLFNIVQEVLASSIMQEKYMKGIQFRKKEITSSLFADDIIIHIGSPKESTQKNPRTKINELYKVIEHKLNTNTIFFTVFYN